MLFDTAVAPDANIKTLNVAVAWSVEADDDE
jgi:hypothetical protein